MFSVEMFSGACLLVKIATRQLLLCNSCLCACCTAVVQEGKG